MRNINLVSNFEIEELPIVIMMGKDGGLEMIDIADSGAKVTNKIHEKFQAIRTIKNE